MAQRWTHRLIVTINGPGEVAGWLYPLAELMRQRLPWVKLCVALTPCVYSSGSELSVLRAMPGVGAACSVRETFRFVMAGKCPPDFEPQLPGCVLHLGGEAYLALAIAKWSKLPCLAYVERPFLFQSYFDKVLFSGFEHVRESRRPAGSEIIGELMIDASRMRFPVRKPSSNAPAVIGLCPGSRDYIVKYTLPFLSVVADQISGRAPQTRWILVKADFLSMDYIRALPDVHDGRPIEGQNLVFEEGLNGPELATPAGTRIEIRTNKAALADIDLAITIPGTNTAELAVLGIPMVLILPTMQAEVSPLPGLAGHIGRIPVVGRYIKRGLALMLVKSFKFFAHPNRRAGRMVVPELVGRLTAREVSAAVERLLEEDAEKLRLELQTAMGQPGAAERLFEQLRPYFQMPEEVEASSAVSLSRRS